MAGDATVRLAQRGFRLQRVTSSPWILTFTAIGVAVAAFVFLRSDFRARASTASQSPASREIEPRLSGKPWAPFRDTRRREHDATATQRGSEELVERHAAGVVELVAGRTRRALSDLTTAAEASNEPRAWNDLAAASHEAWLRYDAPALLAESLAAADRALAIDPGLPEALFNRALIIEHLGLREDARLAWERYLARDSGSDWAVEARAHRDALAPKKPFLDRLDAVYDAVANDPAVAASLANSDPFGARGMGVVEVLGRWGSATVSGNAAEADRHLRVARRLGDALVSRGGDRMLQRAVAAIDGADAQTRASLAAAHAEYQAGVQAFQERRPVDAEPMIRRAADGFERAHSPVVLSARYTAASTVYEQGHRDDAEKEIGALMPLVTPELPASRAMMLWLLGNCHAARGDYGTATEYLEESAALFGDVGEPSNAAGVRRTLSFIHDRLGDPATAWENRLAALRGLGSESSLAASQMLGKALASIADGAILRREWHTALSFLSLQIDLARRVRDDLLLPDSLLVRAVVRDRLRDRAGARADLMEARAAGAGSSDAAYRAYLRTAELRASAMLSDTAPATADALLSEAIDFLMSDGDRANIPMLLLQRARARRAAGNAAGAMADLERGVADLERHRESLPQGISRWGAFHSAEELFDEAVDLALASNNTAGAFAFAERGRARALTESYGASPVLDYRRLASGTVVVEYTLLPSRLAIFTADASGVHAVAVGCDHDALARDVDALSKAFRDDDVTSARRIGAAVYERLIEPIAPRLLGATTVVFVPDGATATVPFSALSDGQGPYLFEQHAIVVAASGAAHAAAAERRQRVHTPRSVLVVSAPAAAEDEGALAFVEQEARQIGEAYASGTWLRDDGAQFDAMVERAPQAEAIHFGGHAIGDERGIEPASIVLRQNGRERRMGAVDIAKLRLRRTSVVVLAGCGTARGERRAAEGVISVAHGFLSAGAPSVIASLWPIADDASATFFPRLHRRLAEGLSPAEALRETQRECIRRGDVPASLWAAIQDIGS